MSSSYQRFLAETASEMSNDKEDAAEQPTEGAEIVTDPAADQTLVELPEHEIDSMNTPHTSELPCEYTREKPITVLVGPEKTQYFVHRSLFAAKSLYFRAILKDCWEGKKEEIELDRISSDGFGVVADWVYSGQIPQRVKEYPKDGPGPWDYTLHAYKAADLLMIDKLQNELILTEAAILREHGFTWKFRRLKRLHQEELSHTKYYDFVLKSAVVNMMSGITQSSERWDEEVRSVEDTPRVLADLLRSSREWLRKPWRDFLKGDLTEFFVQDYHEKPHLPNT